MTSAAALCAVTAAALAAAIDVRTGRIPNGLAIATAGVGLALAAAGGNGPSIAASLVGLVLGGALMLPAHVIGTTGAGDVKLVAAIGALVGPHTILLTWMYTAIAGGLLAVVVAIRRGRLKQTLAGTAGLIGRTAGAGREIRSNQRNRYALGPAILAGTAVALFT